MAVDARIVIDQTSQAPGTYDHLAILPYPSGLEREWPLRSGGAHLGGGIYTVRPIHPDDADMLQSLVRGLSPESRYFRFASVMPELPERMLARFTLIDYDREMALVAVVRDPPAEGAAADDGRERIVGVSRVITNPDGATCEFSLVVSDDYKGQGIGSRLMQSIMDVARSKGLSEIVGLILTNNSTMLKLMASLGFRVGPFAEDPDFRIATRAL